MTWLRHKEVEHNSLTVLASWALKVQLKFQLSVSFLLGKEITSFWVNNLSS